MPRYRRYGYPPNDRFVGFGNDVLGGAVHAHQAAHQSLVKKRTGMIPFHMVRLQRDGLVPHDFPPWDPRPTAEVPYNQQQANVDAFDHVTRTHYVDLSTPRRDPEPFVFGANPGQPPAPPPPPANRVRAAPNPVFSPRANPFDGPPGPPAPPAPPGPPGPPPGPAGRGFLIHVPDMNQDEDMPAPGPCPRGPPPPPPPAAAVRTPVQFPFPFHRDITANPMNPGRVPRLNMQDLGYRYNPMSRPQPSQPQPPEPQPPSQPEPEQYAIYTPREERRGVKRNGDPLINDDFGPPQPWPDAPVNIHATPLMPQAPQP